MTLSQLLQKLRFVSYYIVIVFFSVSANAQSSDNLKTDSLLKAIKTNYDSSSVSACLALNKIYFFKGMFDSANYYCEKGISISKKNKNYKLHNVLLAAGKNYYMKSSNDSAILFLTQCELYLADADIDFKVNYNSLLASIYQEQGNNTKAIKLFLDAADILVKGGGKSPGHLFFNTYGNIGGAFYREKLFDKAEEYYLKALAEKENVQNRVQVIMLYNKLFNCYINTGKFEKAKSSVDSAYAELQYTDNLEMKQAVFINYGFLYEKTNNYIKAKEYYLKGLIITDSIDNDFYKARILNNLSSISLSLNDYQAAERYALDAVLNAKKYNIFEDLKSAYGNLKIIAEKNGDYKNALAFAELQFNYADSLTNESTKENVLGLEAKYENEKKANEIASLKLSNTQKELAVVRRNRLIAIGSIAAAALLILLGLLNRQNKQKRIIAEKDKKLQQEQIKFLERQQQVISLQSMVNGQETERTRIAKDLHDGLGGLFSTVKMYLSTLQHKQQNLEHDELFKKSFDMVDTAANEVRRIAHNMMPEVLLKMGLINAVKDLCNNISAGRLLQVNLEVNSMDKRLNAATEIMLYRIIQELLNNIIKHASATVAIVQFIKDENRLSITVEDDGKGFNMAETTATAGIETVKSRVDYLNGNISIDSQKNIGTTVSMEFLLAD